MNHDLVQAIRDRAQSRCEYCRMPASLYRLPFQFDHIIAQKHGGITSLDNLALACCHCNAYKGPNIAGRDPVTGELVRLFHPRNDRWSDHFEWQEARLVGRTAVGRVTIHVLAINEPDFLAVRDALMKERVFL